MHVEHTVWKWNGSTFVRVKSNSNVYYSLGSGRYGDTDLDVEDVDTLGELYKMWRDRVDMDRENGDSGWVYRFYKHELSEVFDIATSHTETIDRITEGKIRKYRNKVYFKPIG